MAIRIERPELSALAADNYELGWEAWDSVALPDSRRLYELAYLYPSECRNAAASQVMVGPLGWNDYKNAATIREITQGEANDR